MFSLFLFSHHKATAKTKTSNFLNHLRNQIEIIGNQVKVPESFPSHFNNPDQV